MSDVSSPVAAASAAAPATAPQTPAIAPMDSQGNPIATETTPAKAAAKPAAPVAKKETPAQASAKKKYQIKVDQQLQEVEFDPSNEEEVKRHLQMSKAAYKRMQETADMRKGVEELISLLKTDPLKVISDPRLAIDPATRKRLAESIINNEIEELQKTPEQREKERLQKEYELLKQQHEQERRAREQAEFARMQEQQVNQLDTEISDAIEKSGLPKNARTVRYYAEALKFCLQNGLDLNAGDLTPYIKKQATSEFRELLGLMPDEEFEQFLGKDQLSRIRKRNIAKAKAAVSNPANIKSTGQESNKEETKKPEKVHMRDFLKSLGR